MTTLKAVDESFLETAPQRFSHSWEITQPADQVWTQLVGDRPLYWCRGLNIAWTSPAPLGVGSTRQATVLGLVKVQEHFFIWEENRRHTFYGASMNLPLFNALVEDYVVEPLAEDRCRFTWRIGIEPSALGKPGAPLNGLIFANAFRDTARHFRVS
ncbi:SRPBCC family protein [Conexibacter sp. DBS9H8]|uniref:SRPBCC family protein n=1 Tax=Conexibacter sp. DBS9H8 TaxID=2937801 RepID=UPI00200DAF75|nr:SRPBCC family protein [Conexibacter sp. DBS9H8]